jgi:hypothetical protein
MINQVYHSSEAGPTIDRIHTIREADKFCVRHLGAMPHYVKQQGGLHLIGLTTKGAVQLIKQARALEDAGAYDNLFTFGIKALRVLRQDVRCQSVMPIGSKEQISDNESNRFMDIVG